MSAENALLQYEGGQQAFAMSALTNSGDNIIFSSAATLWSQRTGFAPVVRPNGLISGGALSATATNNQVAVTALSCNLNGVVTSVASGNVLITRPSTAVSKVCSITVNAGGTLAVVAGTDGSSAAFSETRGAVGGPPLIPVDSIEIGQVRVTSNTAAVITAAQIFAVPGLHVERADGPLFDVDYATGRVVFQSALPLIHTGPAPKAVHASYSAPIFASVARATDFVMPETSYSVTSTQIYGGTIGATSATLNQGSFTAYFNNGITDPLVTLKGQNLWFKFFPDRYQTAYTLAQGKLGITRSFPAADEIQAACTISASAAGVEVG
jgi:hypothetical protein